MDNDKKVRRRELLPPYMQNDIWLELADAIAEVWGQSVEVQMDALGKLRDLWVSNGTVEAKVAERQLIDPTEYSVFDPSTEMLRLNLLGLQLTSPNFIEVEGMARLNRNMANHWYSKGLGDFIDFLGYCLNVRADMINLWTTDYENFLPEGHQGLAVWEGGNWYPTTHVRVQFDPALYDGFSLAVFVQLFYDIANYNLVVESIISETTIKFERPNISMGLVILNHHFWWRDMPDLLIPQVDDNGISIVKVDENEHQIPVVVTQ